VDTKELLPGKETGGVFLWFKVRFFLTSKKDPTRGENPNGYLITDPPAKKLAFSVHRSQAIFPVCMRIL
jgi:hypothetical protein